VGDLGALGRGGAVLEPLPQLRARDLGRGRVLHQVVDGHAAHAAQPRLHVLQADRDVAADAALGDLARDVEGEEVLQIKYKQPK